MEAMLTIAPPPVSSIAGISYLSERKTPSRLIASALRNWSGRTSARGVGACPPPAALLTATSSPPSSSSAAATIRCTAAGSETSVGTGNARPPMFAISAATRASASASRAASTTAAPARAIALAISAPIPRLAPVTIARRPSSIRAASAISSSGRRRAAAHRDRQAQDEDGEDPDATSGTVRGPTPTAIVKSPTSTPSTAKT